MDVPSIDLHKAASFFLSCVHVNVTANTNGQPNVGEGEQQVEVAVEIEMEVEVEVKDFSTMNLILESIGFQRQFIY